MSMPPQPPGYPQNPGYPPHQGHPQGQQPYPQNPGYPQPGPYGSPAPQQGPWPQQGGWGAPPPPPKKKGLGTGAVLGISFGIVAGLLALAWVGNHWSGIGGGSSPFPEATHKVTVPETLLGGTYKLADDMSDKVSDELKGTSEANIRDAKGVAAQYTSTEAGEGGVLVVSGMYGRIRNPDLAREKILEGGAEADGALVAVPPKDFTPAGSDVTISCQVLTVDQTVGDKTSFPMCAWADDNTNVSVGEVTTGTATKDPESIDLAAAAATTVKVREEMRKPIG
ncbi:hypothetical protein [Streptomyces sp. NPDC000410]|uniref:hypothetical protein n=1 Tax=Streptomyces sp. NPDC000410 TaxID=3154254 RepID=UPI00332A4D56